MQTTNQSLIKTPTNAKVLGASQALNQKTNITKWMLASLLTIGTLLMATKLFAAENLFEKNYQSQNTGGLTSLQASPDTKM